ncbi:MAG: transporter [Deltaproteobacteria bacterium]|nr:transporter [Deltaproteobacteria bacterium]
MRGMRSAIFLALLAATGAHAQDLEPRLYSNVPTGMNFLVAGYGYSEGGVLSDPAVPLEDGNVRIHGPVLGYARSLDLWGMSGKVDAIVPYGCASGSAVFQGEFRERDICGFADPRFRISANLYGAPAMTLEEFARYRQDLIVGASLQVSAPLGQYDGDKLLNIGTNRWFFKPEIGMGKALGPVTLELAASAFFYTRNSDFLGGQEKEQDPIYSVQGHFIYALRSGVWFAVDGTFYRGGRSTVDGVEGDDLQENSRVGATLAFPVNRYHSVKLFGSTGVSTRTGNDFDTIGVAWQYRWGAGL